MLLVTFFLFKIGVNNGKYTMGIMNSQDSNIIDLNSTGNIIIEMLKGLNIHVKFFLIVILFIWLNDIDCGVIKNILVQGFSRKQVYIGKQLAISIVAIFWILAYIFLSYILGIVYLNKISFPVVEILKIFIGQSILYSAVVALTLFFAVLVKRKSLIIFVYILGDVFSKLLGFLGTIFYDPVTLLSSIAWNHKGFFAITTTGMSSYSYCIFIGVVILISCTYFGSIIFENQDFK